MKYLLLSAAALAMTATTGLSAQGNGNDKGDRGNPSAQKADRGNGNNRGSGNGNGNARPERFERADRGPGNGNNGNQARRAQNNAAEREMRAMNPGNGNGNGNGNRNRDRADDYERAVRNVAGQRNVQRADRGRDYNDDIASRVIRNVAYPSQANRGLIDGCPPGLAKKNNGCNPPGQIKNQRSVFGTAYRPSLFGYSNYDNGRYYYDDGYLVRLGDRGGISSYLPLLGGALAIGNPWPSSYQSASLPDYYVDYYDLGGRNSYRYADNVIYRVDPQTSAIQSIAALLTGDDFVVGQRVPSGYDVYNVPYDYRDRYYDTPEHYYRYSDGYVYQIDPTTQLVAAAIDLLV